MFLVKTFVSPQQWAHFLSLLKIKTQFIYSEIHPFLCILLWVLMNIQLHNKHEYQDTAQPQQAPICLVPRGTALVTCSLISVLWLFPLHACHIKGIILNAVFESGFFHLDNASDIHPFVSCINSKFLLNAEQYYITEFNTAWLSTPHLRDYACPHCLTVNEAIINIYI